MLLVTASLCKRADLGSVNLGRFVVSGRCTGPFVCLGDPKSLSANLFVEAQEGPGSKQQAASGKHQAPSTKHKASSGKPQA